jgi:hypothetical protein
VKNSLKHLALMVGVAAAAAATTVLPMTVEKLANISSHVIEGKAVQSWSQWDASHTMISTYTKFQVQRALKGQPPAYVVVKQLGGRVGNFTQKVAGVHHWQTGENAFLFLRPGLALDGTLVVTGTIQGNFLVKTAADGTRVASNGMPEVNQYNVSTGTVTSFGGNTMRLKDLESRVQKAVQQ